MEAMVRQCEIALGFKVQQSQNLTGGDINRALLLRTDRGSFFVKYNTSSQAIPLLESERKGLQLLRQSKTITIPEVLHFGHVDDFAYLVLPFIENQAADANFWETFGRQLAQMHQSSAQQFGLDHFNYIGHLPQSNQWHATWPSFYVQERLQPQLEMALHQGQCSPSFARHFERIYPKIEQICPTEPPALIHGDLWNGNFMCAAEGTPTLIDPSVAYAHREMDLAMSRLFGGFAPRFYEAYAETYPLAPELEDRLALYQLYYLMAHVNLFGGSYLQSVQSILKTYLP